MSIKLLPKSEIANLKAKDQEREIKEGIKIATRVDGLRELQSKTEQDLERYRTVTLERIGEEIKSLNSKKEELLGNISQLQGKYDAMLPEMATKRTELAQFEKSLNGWERKLEKREENASLMEIDVMEALEKAEGSRIRNEDNERISRNLLVQSNEKKEESEKTLKTVRKIQDQVYADKKNIEEALNLRELSIQTKENELSSKELSLINEKKEFEKEKIKVLDRQATLDRSLARLKAGRLP